MQNIASSLFRPFTTHLVIGTDGDEKYVRALRLIRKVFYTGSKYQIFCPEIDPRINHLDKTFKFCLEQYSGPQPIKINIETVKSSKEILEKIHSDTTTVGIFGAHFFDMFLPDVVNKLKKEGKYIVIAGADKTFECDPFGPIGYLAIDADSVYKRYDNCSHIGCSNVGTRIQMNINNQPSPWGTDILQLGEDVSYSKVCLAHHNCPDSPENRYLSQYKGISEKVGKLFVFFGTMCSGKSEMMIAKTLHESRKQNIKSLFIKPAIDTRTPNEIVSRTFKETGTYGIRFPAEEIDEENMWEFAEKAKDWKKKVIGIDEAQLIPDVSYFVNALRILGHDVVVSGLAKEFRSNLFGDMDYLICEAEHVEPLEAICTQDGCKNKATEVQRLVNGKPATYDSPTIVIEGSDTKVTYHPRCVYHQIIPGKPEYLERKHRRKS